MYFTKTNENKILQNLNMITSDLATQGNCSRGADLVCSQYKMANRISSHDRIVFGGVCALDTHEIVTMCQVVDGTYFHNISQLDISIKTSIRY